MITESENIPETFPSENIPEPIYRTTCCEAEIPASESECPACRCRAFAVRIATVFAAVLMLLIAFGCATVERVNIAASIRRTSNVEATKRCTYLTEITDEGTLGSLIPNGADPTTYLVYIPPGGGVRELYDQCK